MAEPAALLFAGDADFLARARARLDPDLARPTRLGGDHDLNPGHAPAPAEDLRPAAVLCPLIARPDGLHFILTTRTADMPTHAGQIAFPGGGMRPGDSSLAAAALREAEEEIGLAPVSVEILGGFGAFETVSGFLVAPVIGLVSPGFVPRADPREVADVFETPLSFLMNPANHLCHSREWRGRARFYYAMPWGDRYIWGATARMIKGLYDHLWPEDPH